MALAAQTLAPVLTRTKGPSAGEPFVSLCVCVCVCVRAAVAISPPPRFLLLLPELYSSSLNHAAGAVNHMPQTDSCLALNKENIQMLASQTN